MIACTVLEHNCTKAMHANAGRQKRIQSNSGAASATKCELQHCKSDFHGVQVCVSLNVNTSLNVKTNNYLHLLCSGTIYVA